MQHYVNLVPLSVSYNPWFLNHFFGDTNEIVVGVLCDIVHRLPRHSILYECYRLCGPCI